MPIVVEVKSKEDYAAWVADQKKKLAAAAEDPASSGRTRAPSAAAAAGKQPDGGPGATRQSHQARTVSSVSGRRFSHRTSRIRSARSPAAPPPAASSRAALWSPAASGRLPAPVVGRDGVATGTRGSQRLGHMPPHLPAPGCCLDSRLAPPPRTSEPAAREDRTRTRRPRRPARPPPMPRRRRHYPVQKENVSAPCTKEQLFLHFLDKCIDSKGSDRVLSRTNTSSLFSTSNSRPNVSALRACSTVQDI